VKRSSPPPDRRPDDWRLDRVADHLAARLAATLPGVSAHVLMAPRPRSGWQPATVPADARAAAALILLYPAEPDTREAALPLIVRSTHLARHSGQVSLPGGAVEPGEEIGAAALREAEEEIGIDASAVRILGRLSPLHIPVSGFVLHPVVGVIETRPLFRPDDHEVARIVEIPVAALAGHDVVRLRMRSHEGRDYEVPYFALDDLQVWGATAMVLGEFLVLLDAAPRSHVI
jgi:8-oxo-dGTP pyrophosphatase MutT (NUDIX family)